MHKLYLEMWNRLNEDKQQYQEQATDYFSHADKCTESYPISLFELMVALDPPLQRVIVDDLKPQDPIKLAQDCIAMRTRVMTRSAGLLEFSTVSDSDDEDSQSNVSLSSIETLNYTGDLARSPPDQSYQSSCGSAVDGEVKNITGIHSQDDDLPIDLAFYNGLKLKYLHRTARDFLMDTEDGQKLSGSPRELPVTRSNSIIRARMAALLQGLSYFEEIEVRGIMFHIQGHILRYSNVEHETGLVVALRRLCQKLSIPGDPRNHIGYRDFWCTGYEGFECVAASFGFAKYIQNFVLDRDSYIDPYSRGLLAQKAADSEELFENEQASGKLTLFSWLVLNGADLHIQQMQHLHDMPRSAAVEILCTIDKIVSWGDQTHLRRSYDTICHILPYLSFRSCNGIVMLDPRKDWAIVAPRGPWWFVDGNRIRLHVQISVIKLCYLVIGRIEQTMPHRPPLR